MGHPKPRLSSPLPDRRGVYLVLIPCQRLQQLDDRTEGCTDTQTQLLSLKNLPSVAISRGYTLLNLLKRRRKSREGQRPAPLLQHRRHHIHGDKGSVRSATHAHAFDSAPPPRACGWNMPIITFWVAARINVSDAALPTLCGNDKRSHNSTFCLFPFNLFKRSSFAQNSSLLLFPPWSCHRRSPSRNMMANRLQVPTHRTKQLKNRRGRNLRRWWPLFHGLSGKTFGRRTPASRFPRLSSPTSPLGQACRRGWNSSRSLQG